MTAFKVLVVIVLLIEIQVNNEIVIRALTFCEMLRYQFVYITVDGLTSRYTDIK